MPLIKSSSEKAFRTNVAEMRRAGHPRDQALAASYHNQREAKAKGMAKGGGAEIPGQMPAGGFDTPGAAGAAGAAVHMHGLIKGAGSGRSDSIPLKVPKGGHMIPADVVSGLGHGDTIAGARALEHTFPMQDRKPFGRAHVRGFNPIMKSPFAVGFHAGKYARGGSDDEGDMTEIMGSSGEFYVHPDAIQAKYGNMKHGHNIIDAWIMHRRKQTIAEMRKLKPPKNMDKKLKK